MVGFTSKSEFTIFKGEIFKGEKAEEFRSYFELPSESQKKEVKYTELEIFVRGKFNSILKEIYGAKHYEDKGQELLNIRFDPLTKKVRVTLSKKTEKIAAFEKRIQSTVIDYINKKTEIDGKIEEKKSSVPAADKETEILNTQDLKKSATSHTTFAGLAHNLAKNVTEAQAVKSISIFKGQFLENLDRANCEQMKKFLQEKFNNFLEKTYGKDYASKKQEILDVRVEDSKKEGKKLVIKLAENTEKAANFAKFFQEELQKHPIFKEILDPNLVRTSKTATIYGAVHKAEKDLEPYPITIIKDDEFEHYIKGQDIGLYLTDPKIKADLIAALNERIKNSEKLNIDKHKVKDIIILPNERKLIAVLDSYTVKKDQYRDEFRSEFAKTFISSGSALRSESKFSAAIGSKIAGVEQKFSRYDITLARDNDENVDLILQNKEFRNIFYKELRELLPKEGITINNNNYKFDRATPIHIEAGGPGKGKIQLHLLSPTSNFKTVKKYCEEQKFYLRACQNASAKYEKIIQERNEEKLRNDKALKAEQIHAKDINAINELIANTDSPWKLTGEQQNLIKDKGELVWQLLDETPGLSPELVGKFIKEGLKLYDLKKPQNNLLKEIQDDLLILLNSGFAALIGNKTLKSPTIEEVKEVAERLANNCGVASIEKIDHIDAGTTVYDSLYHKVKHFTALRVAGDIRTNIANAADIKLILNNVVAGDGKDFVYYDITKNKKVEFTSREVNDFAKKIIYNCIEESGKDNSVYRSELESFHINDKKTNKVAPAVTQGVEATEEIDPVAAHKTIILKVNPESKSLPAFFNAYSNAAGSLGITEKQLQQKFIENTKKSNNDARVVSLKISKDKREIEIGLTAPTKKDRDFFKEKLTLSLTQLIEENKTTKAQTAIKAQTQIHHIQETETAKLTEASAVDDNITVAEAIKKIKIIIEKDHDKLNEFLAKPQILALKTNIREFLGKDKEFLEIIVKETNSPALESMLTQQFLYAKPVCDFVELSSTNGNYAKYLNQQLSDKSYSYQRNRDQNLMDGGEKPALDKVLCDIVNSNILFDENQDAKTRQEQIFEAGEEERNHTQRLEAASKSGITKSFEPEKASKTSRIIKLLKEGIKSALSKLGMNFKPKDDERVIADGGSFSGKSSIGDSFQNNRPSSQLDSPLDARHSHAAAGQKKSHQREV